MPMLYAGFVPSTVTSSRRPSASWPIAPRGCLLFKPRASKDSLAWKTGLPFLTSIGPPPMAPAKALQSGESDSRASTCCPTRASAFSWATDAAPRATRTAPWRGIRVGPPLVTCVTVPSSASPGRAGGKVAMTSSTTPDSLGVAVP
jgi:hypothetical protein